jgi:hypothetical protein
MMAEIGDVVELITDIPDRNLRAGVKGTIVHSHSNRAYEVEFTNEEGETLDFLAVRPEQFIVVWRAETQEWVPIAEQAAALVANLPDEAGREVLNFARFLSVRAQRASASQDRAIEELLQV